MKIRSRLLATLLVLLPVATATAADWHRVDDAKFSVIGVESPRRLVELLRDVRGLEWAMIRFARAGRPLPAHPVRIYALPPKAWGTLFRARVAGVAVVRPFDTLLLYNAALDAEQTTAVMYHEYAHYLLAQGTDVPLPSWFNEGTAEFWSSYERDGDEVLIGAAPLGRLESLLDGERWLPGRELLTWRGGLHGDLNAVKVPLAYAQSWLAVHYLTLGRPGGYEQAWKYVRLLDAGVSIDDAFARSFGFSIAQLDDELRRYLRARKMQYLRVTVGPEVVADSPPAQRVTDAAAAAMLGQLALQLNPDRSIAEGYFREALQLEPRQPEALAGLARLARVGGDDARATELHAELAAMPGLSATTRRYVAGSLLMDASGAVPIGTALRAGNDAAMAIRLLEPLLVSPADAEAAWLHGVAHLQLGTPRDALPAVVAACDAGPTESSLAALRATLLARLGQREAAREWFGKAAMVTADPRLRRQLFAAMDSGELVQPAQ